LSPEYGAFSLTNSEILTGAVEAMELSVKKIGIMPGKNDSETFTVFGFANMTAGSRLNSLFYPWL
jgi:hypothetical protein